MNEIKNGKLSEEAAESLELMKEEGDIRCMDCDDEISEEEFREHDGLCERCGCALGGHYIP